ncbi:hypothetical protein BJX76DRAFT_36504 [Aspergillus varians]
MARKRKGNGRKDKESQDNDGHTYLFPPIFFFVKRNQGSNMMKAEEALLGGKRALDAVCRESNLGVGEGASRVDLSRASFIFSFFPSCWTVDKIKIKTHYLMTYQAWILFVLLILLLLCPTTSMPPSPSGPPGFGYYVDINRMHTFEANPSRSHGVTGQVYNAPIEQSRENQRFSLDATQQGYN